jgi:hypothetical protein
MGSEHRFQRQSDIGLESFIESAIDPTGFTDRISNVMAFHGPDPFEIIRSNAAVTANGQYLKLFLHEATHHACFAGILGSTLASLSASCLSHDDTPESDEAPLTVSLPGRDLIIDKWLFSAMEPLIEGAALFAEFDAVCGNAPIVSQPMGSAMHLGAPSLAQQAAALGIDPNIDPLRLLNATLTRARLEPSSVEDKAYLLSSPLCADHGYLLGYLAVKAFYAHLRLRCLAVSDSDLFLTGLINHFFSDEQLARLALATDDLDVERVQTTIRNICDHLQDRWRDLHDNTTARFEAMTSDILAKSKPNSSFEADNIRNIDDLTFLTGLRTAPLAMQIFWPKIFQHRHILRYSARRVHISVEGAGNAVLRGMPDGPVLMICPAVPLADKGRYPGTIEAVASYSGEVRAIVVLGESGLVSLWQQETGQWNDENAIKVLDDLPPMDRVIRSAEMIAEAARARRTLLSRPARETLGIQHEQARTFAKFLCLQMALPYWPAEARAAFGEVLMDRGFAALFGEDELMTLARLSIAFGGPGRSVESTARVTGMSQSEVEDYLEVINRSTKAKLGFEVMPIDEGYVTSLV